MKNTKIKLIIFDIDNTLVYGDSALEYYKQYPPLLEKVLSDCMGISLLEAKQIADQHRMKFNGRGEKSFETYQKDIRKWYDAICTLNTDIYIPYMKESQGILKILKERGYVLGAITDGPTTQAYRIMRSAQIDQQLFSFLIGWERGERMPKGGFADVFERVLKECKLKPEEVLMVGDSLETDIFPAHACGMSTLLISDKEHEKFVAIKSITSVLNYI